MSDSVHFRVFASCERLDGTVREGGMRMGAAGTSSRFPRLLTSRESDQTDLGAGANEAGHSVCCLRVKRSR